jgi:hypothetical protein
MPLTTTSPVLDETCYLCSDDANSDFLCPNCQQAIEYAIEARNNGQPQPEQAILRNMAKRLRGQLNQLQEDFHTVGVDR